MRCLGARFIGVKYTAHYLSIRLLGDARAGARGRVVNKALLLAVRWSGKRCRAMSATGMKRTSANSSNEIIEPA